jgi:hemerythrin
MEWKTEYSVGIEEIDKHHQIFFEYFRRLEESIQHGKSWADQYYLIEQLKEYARFHFAVEEAMMRMHGYDHTDAHAALHSSFIDHVMALEKKALNYEVTMEIAGFMRKWFIEHICSDDMDYANSIANRIEKLRHDRQ